MTKKMLIDATHAEETRVAIIEDHKLAEYDYESTFRKPLKGNIFLAKVTRVEPSLQAAFVNFGGNRHGFLPFSEIHPDYFRIPIADREALIAEQEAILEEQQKRHDMEEEEGESKDTKGEDEESNIAQIDDPEVEIEEVGGEEPEEKPKKKGRKSKKDKEAEEAAAKLAEETAEESDKDKAENKADAGEAETDSEDAADDENEDNKGNRRGGRGRGRGGRGRGGRSGGGGRNNSRGRGRARSAAHSSQRVEVLGGTDYDDEESNERFRFNLRRKYKIQEVIKRGQIMLVQVSREERGNKGAAVSSYLSLPGRYCVLMPNSPHAGGVSRKISSFSDRRRIRDMMKEMETPKGMSVIVRTAGMARPKPEVKRDLDYLMRLWNSIRELTLKSSAPSLVYEEADLIKRCIRDLYSRDIEEIHVAGDEGYETAKNFMKMMIPSHVKRIKQHKEADHPLFQAFKVEQQINDISDPNARLRSGGYLVINPTEALVSIDVNSGRATKERHIEETALKTNLEAADEVARQLRLRDLGGLVVIDFIDMEDRRNNAKVERRLKEALSQDRARIQIGRISSFGLLEMSRQRLNPSLTEAQFELCDQCGGTGRVRTADSTSILIMRSIEEEGMKNRAAELIVHVPHAVALYILNYKRAHMAEMEAKYGFKILIRIDDDQAGDDYRIEVSRPNTGDEDDADGEENASDNDDNNQDDKQSSRRGGRGGRNNNRGRGRGRDNRGDSSDSDDKAVEDANAEASDESIEGDKSEEKPKRGRRKSAQKDGSADDKAAVKEEVQDDKIEEPKEEAKEEKPKRGRKKAEPKVIAASEEKVEEPKKDDKKKSSGKKANDNAGDKKSSKAASAKKEEPKDEAPKDDIPKDYEVVNEAPTKKKKGWWNKL